MSTLEVVDAWLRHWAERRSGAHAPAAGPMRPHGDDDEQVEAVIAALPESLKLSVEECYLNDGDHASHARRLGCPPWTLTRRLSRVHRLVHGAMLESRQRVRRDLEVSDMRRRLDETA